ncbi:MAG: FAD:protein FMN transferase [Sulfuricurvum sp.]|nr:FAD:protein FMN transferase [Sulfuricurvum sp.]
MKTIVMVLILGIKGVYAERTQVHMGTMIHVNVSDVNASDAVFNEFGYLDQTLSTYKKDSEVSLLNRNFELNASEVTREILVRSVEMYRLSEGAFDVTVGSLTHKGYRFGYDDERLPDLGEVERLGQSIQSTRIHIVGKTVRVEPKTVIDLGGIGKGYAVDRGMAILIQRGITKGIIAASGDIGCLDACDIAVQDPFHPDGSIATIQSTLKRFAVSTSGNYERYVKNKSNNHLINPKTYQPQQQYASVTLMDTGDNTRLDALATAVSVMGEKRAISMLEKLDIAYILVRNDGTITHKIRIPGVRVTFKRSEK